MSRKSLRLADYLEHAREAVDRIERYTDGLDFDGFAGSEMIQDAVIRNLEIIGEALANAERVDPDPPQRGPDFPLRQAKEMRNVLAHGYFGVDLAVVWQTIRTDLPLLAVRIRQVQAAGTG